MLFVFALSACHIDDPSTDARPVVDSSRAAAVNGTPVPLPFDNPFPNRWNASNDGTSFEPCVAYTSGELSRFKVDSSKIEDVAQVDGQSTRGCHWYMSDQFDLGQLVTDASSLDEYRTASTDLDWKPDLEVGGRTVGLFAVDYGTSKTCSTYVQSFSAGVVTNVITSTSPYGQSVDACKLVIDFTRAYIDKIPE
ncbi:DUF3558 family protein [Williamsia soli]|uniref:DUF3558 family protein n=1 Tax=Williamsia soli TaxID=364929 RepID=UPI001A9D607B|nr:DUF3558 family protein [Williamsia soli]